MRTDSSTPKLTERPTVAARHLDSLSLTVLGSSTGSERETVDGSEILKKTESL